VGGGVVACTRRKLHGRPGGVVRANLNACVSPPGGCKKLWKCNLHTASLGSRSDGGKVLLNSLFGFACRRRLNKTIYFGEKKSLSKPAAGEKEDYAQWRGKYLHNCAAKLNRERLKKACQHQFLEGFGLLSSE